MKAEGSITAEASRILFAHADLEQVVIYQAVLICRVVDEKCVGTFCATWNSLEAE